MTKLDDIVAIKDFAEQSDTKVPFVFLSKKKYLIKEHLTKKSHVQDYFAFIKKNVDIYDILYILKSKSFVEYYRNGNKSIESLKAFKIDCLSNITTSGKISFFDGFDPQKIKSLYKYIPLNRFLKNLEDNELVLVSPKTWRDPYEKKYWLADYSALSFTRPNIYCMCLTQNCRKNEDAAWNLYTYNKNEKIIQIEYYTSKLLDKLSKDASIKKIYIGNAIYDFTSPEINNLYKNGKKGHFQFFNEFNEEKFINLLRVKRKSYAFENEVRLFVETKCSNGSEETVIIKNVNLSAIIKSVRLAPFYPFDLNDCRNAVYKQLQKTESNCIKMELSKRLPKIKIHQSFLYTEARKNISIEKSILK